MKYPLDDARYNEEQIIQNILLLTDHLLEPEKRCMWCIYKHIYTIRAYCNEALSLSNANLVPNLSYLCQWIEYVEDVTDKRNISPIELGENARKVRQKILKDRKIRELGLTKNEVIDVEFEVINES